MKKRVIIIGAVIASIVAIIFAVRGVNNVIRKQKFDDLITNADNIKVGDIIEFGPYEWRVLEKKGKQLLIITNSGITVMKYNDPNINMTFNVTWEICTLRKWLNEDFYYSQFNFAEQSRILTTEVAAGTNPKHSTDPGNDTQDKVFLLSIDEVNKYFDSDSDRICTYNRLVYGGNHCWWLRSPGNNSDFAARVKPNGSVDYTGQGNWGMRVGEAVRPAWWLNLES